MLVAGEGALPGDDGFPAGDGADALGLRDIGERRLVATHGAEQRVERGLQPVEPGPIGGYVRRPAREGIVGAGNAGHRRGRSLAGLGDAVQHLITQAAERLELAARGVEVLGRQPDRGDAC
ncbi:MAG: hypothetical protein NTV19_20725 [Burkholderiales bacterium]|nr:hypothetical protein [Burkholderiales bacterium]